MATNFNEAQLKKIQKILLIFSLTLSSSLTFSQFNLGEMYQGWFPRKNNAPKLMHRFAVDLLFNRWYNEPSNITLEPYSIGLNVYRMIDIPFNNHIGISIGGGFSFENYHHNGQFVTTILPDGNEFTSIEPFASGYDYKRNKISLNYFDIPFEIRIRSKDKPRFNVYPGVKFGYLFNAHTKTIDNTGKYKNYNVPNFDQYRYGVSLRMGWGKNFHIYTYYQLTSIFKKDRGEIINPFAIGFTFYFI